MNIDRICIVCGHLIKASFADPLAICCNTCDSTEVAKTNREALYKDLGKTEADACSLCWNNIDILMSSNKEEAKT